MECNNINLSFTTNKALHSLEVANFMRNRAPLLGVDPDKAWLTGWCHDIGYVHGGPYHNESGAQMACLYSDELAEYVRLHDSKEPIKDHLQFLLVLADWVIDETGKYVGVHERAQSILRRDCLVSEENLKMYIRRLAEYAEKHNLEDFYERVL